MAGESDRLRAALADRYTIERELGRGGMATVYLAHDRKLGRPVALKVLKPELAAAIGPERFLREIEIAAKLTHPHILAVYDSGHTGGWAAGRLDESVESPAVEPSSRQAVGFLYYTMPYVEGESLRDRLTREKQLPLEDALQITREVADALGYAHSLGLVHRDVKPENILFEAGHAVVADFGIARAIHQAGGEQLTSTGLAVGTPQYMSPEQATGSRDLDGRSDLYALGCVLYEMLAGQPPFTGPTVESVVHQHLAAAPPTVTAIRQAVPAEVATAIARALAKAPADRYSTASQFAEALRTGAVLTPVAVPASAPRRRRRVMAAAGVLGVIAALAIGAVLVARRAERAVLDGDAIAVVPFRISSSDAELRAIAQQVPDLFWARVTGEFGPRTADPALVLERWKVKGGSPETPIPDAGAIEIAQAIGAGRLVVGSLTGTAASLKVTASLLEVPSGRVRVPAMTVEGTYDSFPVLVDRLIVQMLGRGFGVPTADLQQLAPHPPLAVFAYLRGLRATRELWLDAQWFDRALELDSTLLLAALAKYQAGETDQATVRFLSERQAALNPRDRAFFRALAGWRFGATRTIAERLAQYDSLLLRDPDWITPLGDLAEQTFVWSGAIGMPEGRDRARRLDDRYARLSTTDLASTYRLFALAAFTGDAAQARLHGDEYVRRVSESALQVRLLTNAHLWSLRLQLALLEGDSVAAAALWSRGVEVVRAGASDASAGDAVYGAAVAPIVGGLLVGGRGLRDLDRFIVAVRAVDATPSFPIHNWARIRGRYGEWRAIRDALYDRMPPVTRAGLLVRDVLFLGEPEDARVREGAALLDRVARGQVSVPPDSSDPTPADVAPGRARCWSTLWRLSHGQIEGARQAQLALEDMSLAYRWSVCAGLIDVLVTQREGGDVRRAVVALDSIVKPGPLEMWPFNRGARDLTVGIDNLIVARLLAQYGDTARALAAVRRGPWTPTANGRSPHWSLGLLPEFLREEGRLAAAAGDMAGAVRAYEHYLKLREDPEPPWRAQRDSVERELAGLSHRR